MRRPNVDSRPHGSRLFSAIFSAFRPKQTLTLLRTWKLLLQEGGGMNPELIESILWRVLSFEGTRWPRYRCPPILGSGMPIRRSMLYSDLVFIGGGWQAYLTDPRLTDIWRGVLLLISSTPWIRGVCVLV